MEWFSLQPTHFWIAPSLFLYSLVLWRILRTSVRVRMAWVFLGLWAVVLFASYLPPSWVPTETALTYIAHSLVDLATFQLLAVTIFYGLLRRFHVKKFLTEAIIGAGYAVVLVNLLRQLGVNVTGIFATSAVAAAVVGFALQDMLSNIAGGIALELGGGIKVGDFIKCGEWSGWVDGVSLRQTVIRAADGDSIILPNSQLYRSPVRICAPVHRHYIPFMMPHTVNSQELIDTVEFALRGSPISGVASDPAPSCVVSEITEDGIRYAAVVWLTRPGHTGGEVSAVLTRIGFALERAGIPFGDFSHTVEIKEEQTKARESVTPIDLLRRSPILRLLDDTDLFELGSRLHRLSFAPGEYIIRQGEPGGSMYFVGKGKIKILYRGPNDVEREVSEVDTGGFFGETALLTGEPRNASAQAASRVDCYELDKAGLQDIVRRRPDFVDDVSTVMAQRTAELGILRDKLDEETARLRLAEAQRQLRFRIRSFFGWNSPLPGETEIKSEGANVPAPVISPEFLLAAGPGASMPTQRPQTFESEVEPELRSAPDPAAQRVESVRLRAAVLLKARRFTEARKALEEADALEGLPANRANGAGSKSPVGQKSATVSKDTKPGVKEIPSRPPPDTVDKAVAIVERYSRIAAGAGLVPGTILTFAAILAVQVTMVWKIARCFGHREGTDRIRGSILSLLGAALPATLGHGAALAVITIPALIAGSVLYFLITPVLAYALTKAVGNTFVMHFESGGTLLTFDATAFQEYFLKEFEAAGADLKAA
jgi:small-conductance mechanosensitive channel/CRP-like cAMP-binding protein